MPREEIIVPNREISYEGFFSINEVLDIVKRFLDERDYTRVERVHEHKLLADGAAIEIKGYHERKITEQDKLELEVHVYANGVKEVEQVVNGEKRKTNQGRISFTLKAILFMDDAGDWERDKGSWKFRPLVQWLADRFVFTEHVDEIRAACKREADELYARLAEYFQAQQYRREI